MQKFDAFWEAIPDLILPLANKKRYTLRDSFGIILNGDSTLGATDIGKIAEKSELSPLFICLDFESLDRVRALARQFDSRVVIPRGIKEFFTASESCNFIMSEHLRGALFSFLSCTPLYLSVRDEDCREFIGELVLRQIGGGIVSPYTKNGLGKIKKVGAVDSDFYGALNAFRAELTDKLRELTR